MLPTIVGSSPKEVPLISGKIFSVKNQGRDPNDIEFLLAQPPSQSLNSKINFSLDDEKITNRLAIPTKSVKKCGAIKADHMIIRKAQDSSNLELLAL